MALSTVALVLDGVDGRVARRTDTTSAFGARFDMEVDAFLIMVLMCMSHVSRAGGVLAMGLARYAFVAAGWVLPWRARSAAAPAVGQVVAAIVGVVLTVAAADILPDAVTTALLLVALGLLVESFGRNVWVLWVPGMSSNPPTQPRNRIATGRRCWRSAQHAALAPPPCRIGRGHHGCFPASFRDTLAGSPPGARATVTSALTLLLGSGLRSSCRPGRRPGAERLPRIPVEGLLFVVLVLVLPPRVARILALFGGLDLGALTILRLLDMGFHFAFDRPFHPVYDTAYAGWAVGLLGDSIGRAGALVVPIGAGLLIVALIALLPLSAVRLTRLVATHRRPSIRMLALTAIAMVTTLSGAQLGPAGPIASTASARLAYAHATQVRDDLQGPAGVRAGARAGSLPATRRTTTSWPACGARTFSWSSSRATDARRSTSP